MSTFVPILLLAVTILVMVGFQTLQLARERDALSARKTALTSPLQEVTTVRQQLEAIARDTAVLASGGNANAQQIVAALKQSGITINAEAAAQ